MMQTSSLVLHMAEEEEEKEEEVNLCIDRLNNKKSYLSVCNFSTCAFKVKTSFINKVKSEMSNQC